LPDGLTEEALKVAYQYKYKPALKNGTPVEHKAIIVITFKLDSK
jgi:Gram-negative bacterial TonB protein C-terminal